MDKILTRPSDYFLSNTEMTKPETRSLKDMAPGHFKVQERIRETDSGIAQGALKAEGVRTVPKGRLRITSLKTISAPLPLAYRRAISYLWTEPDISKKHAKYMEGLDFVKNGDTGEIGQGYNVLNINAINVHREKDNAIRQGL